MKTESILRRLAKIEEAVNPRAHNPLFLGTYEYHEEVVLGFNQEKGSGRRVWVTSVSTGKSTPVVESRIGYESFRNEYWEGLVAEYVEAVQPQTTLRFVATTHTEE